MNACLRFLVLFFLVCGGSGGAAYAGTGGNTCPVGGGGGGVCPIARGCNWAMQSLWTHFFRFVYSQAKKNRSQPKKIMPIIPGLMYSTADPVRIHRILNQQTSSGTNSELPNFKTVQGRWSLFNYQRKPAESPEQAEREKDVVKLIRQANVKHLGRKAVEPKTKIVDDAVAQAIQRIEQGATLDQAMEFATTKALLETLYGIPYSDKLQPIFHEVAAQKLARGAVGRAARQKVIAFFKPYVEEIEGKVDRGEVVQGDSYLGDLILARNKLNVGKKEGDKDYVDENFVYDQAIASFTARPTMQVELKWALYLMAKQPEAFGVARTDPSNAKLRTNLAREIERIKPGIPVLKRDAPRTMVAGKNPEWDGVRPGSTLFLDLAGANMDPTAFPEPERVNPYRTNLNTPALNTFSFNRRCPGMDLATLMVERLIVQTAGKGIGVRITRDKGSRIDGVVDNPYIEVSLLR